VVDLLKAGAGFKLLAYSCMRMFMDIDVYPANSVRLCQAAIMAGYAPSSEEVVDMHQFVSGEDSSRVCRTVELVEWWQTTGAESDASVPSCHQKTTVSCLTSSHHTSSYTAAQPSAAIPEVWRQWYWNRSGIHRSLNDDKEIICASFSPMFDNDESDWSDD